MLQLVTVCRPAKSFIFHSGHPDVCTCHNNNDNNNNKIFIQRQYPPCSKALNKNNKIIITIIIKTFKKAANLKTKIKMAKKLFKKKL